MQLFKKRLKGMGIAVLISIILMIILYIIMLVDTNNIFNYVKDIIYGKVPHDEIAGTPLSGYDVTYGRDNVDSIDLKMSRAFVLHNFTDGYVYVKYDCKVYDNSGKLSYMEIASFPHWNKWIIHKENGEWKIVKIYEPQGNLTIFNID